MFPGLMGKKKAATVILGMHHEPEHESEAGEGDDEHAALKAIASDLMAAVHAKDVDRVAAALKAAWAECEAHEEYEE